MNQDNITAIGRHDPKTSPALTFRDRIKELRRVPASSLRANPRNWRKHPEGQRKALGGILAEVGISAAAIVRELPDGQLELIDGHLRADVMDGADIPVLVLDVTQAEADKLLATIDPLAAMAETSKDGLRDLLSQITASSDDMARLLADVAKQNKIQPKVKELGGGVIASPSELLAKWKVEVGQMWALGEHHLICGDVFDPEVWARLGGPFNLCFADPPYELDINVNQLRLACKLHLFLMATDKVLAGQPVKYFRQYFCYTYDQCDVAPWLTMPYRNHTLIGWWVFSRCGKLNLSGLRSVIHSETNHDKAEEHSESKPLELLTPFLNYFSNETEEFADAFAGGGSTLMAAEATGRKARSVELNPACCAAILERFSLATKTQPTLVAE